MTAAPPPEHPPGSEWTDDSHHRVYIIDSRESKYAGLIPATLNGELVLIREADLGVRLHRTETR